MVTNIGFFPNSTDDCDGSNLKIVDSSYIINENSLCSNHISIGSLNKVTDVFWNLRKFSLYYKITYFVGKYNYIDVLEYDEDGDPFWNRIEIAPIVIPFVEEKTISFTRKIPPERLDPTAEDIFFYSCLQQSVNIRFVGNDEVSEVSLERVKFNEQDDLEFNIGIGNQSYPDPDWWYNLPINTSWQPPPDGYGENPLDPPWPEPAGNPFEGDTTPPFVNIQSCDINLDYLNSQSLTEYKKISKLMSLPDPRVKNGSGAIINLFFNLFYNSAYGQNDYSVPPPQNMEPVLNDAYLFDAEYFDLPDFGS